MIISPYVAPGVIRPIDLTIELIIDAVCSYFKCSPSIVFNNSRKREIIDIRNIVIYLSRTMLNKKFCELGEYLNKDHTTIMNSYIRVCDRISVEEGFIDKIDGLKYAIKLKKMGL